ncbi:pollen-specific leucine-rich repeat extensin-like protein 1 [Senna tora]|uniref:Pollen-specific leucine-rich repeat extensin-like protein 1 n=1 Tax=Senna tora TaxID=362788 RepID=A0A834X962_9FABA|nr:pollen-specific leucine-rich repeat extensin-like protein 1 [Senna tora]
MKLKVDLQCHKCYKKVKKVLAKFPQIRDQVFDEKQNIVMIKVVCCSPEKIRDKICCKGGGAIKSIEIVEPKPPEKKEPEKKQDDKPKPKPESDKPKAEEKKKDGDKPKGGGDKPKGDADKPKDKPADSKPKSDDPKPPKLPDPVPVYPPAPPPIAVPVAMCCGPCYDGQPGGPCVYGYGGPPQWYDGYYARPVYDSYGGGRPVYVSRCDQYFSEENPSGCSVM